MPSLFHTAAHCLALADPEAKAAATLQAASQWRSGELTPCEAPPPAPIGEPGRLPRPRLVAPRDLPRRSLAGGQGRAAFVHAIAHIELNAINLAWDALYRFRDMPRQFYGDWVGVAAEEARHFRLLREHLQSLGHDYGDFDAHDGLWEMARRTAHDPLLRMALVPRVLEARGLDVTPAMIQGLRGHGDEHAAGILEVILREEIGHVAIGTRWFRHLCAQRDLPPAPTFRRLVREHLRGGLKGPFNRQARAQAGFEDEELEGWGSP